MKATTTDSLAVHRAVMATAGPEALAGIARPLTDDETALLDGWTARTTAMTDAEFAAYAGVPADMGSELRRLLGDGGAR
jgi:hypothetical protein